MDFRKGLTETYRAARDGVGHVTDVASVLAISAKKNPITTAKCVLSAFAAATVPLAIDGVKNFSPNLTGGQATSNLFETADQKLSNLMGVNATLPDQAAACAAGKIPGLLAGAALSTWVLAAATGGPGAITSANAAQKFLAATVLGATAVNTTKDVTDIFRPNGP